MPTDTESTSLVCIKERSMIKREGYVSWIRSIYSLAKGNMDDLEISYHLLEAVQDLNDVWSKFSIKDDEVLDQLIALDSTSEYSPTLGTEMWELITYSIALATRYRNKDLLRSSFSVRSGSPVSVWSNRRATDNWIIVQLILIIRQSCVYPRLHYRVLSETFFNDRR